MKDLGTDSICVGAARHQKGGDCFELDRQPAPNVRDGHIWGVEHVRMFCDLQSPMLRKLIAIDKAKDVRGRSGANVDRLVSLADPV